MDGAPASATSLSVNSFCNRRNTASIEELSFGPTLPRHLTVVCSIAHIFGFTAGMIRAFLLMRLVFFLAFVIARNDPYNGQRFFQSLTLGFAVALLV
jgi:hypothetical protein